MLEFMKCFMKNIHRKTCRLVCFDDGKYHIRWNEEVCYGESTVELMKHIFLGARSNIIRIFWIWNYIFPDYTVNKKWLLFCEFCELWKFIETSLLALVSTYHPNLMEKQSYKCTLCPRNLSPILSYNSCFIFSSPFCSNLQHIYTYIWLSELFTSSWADYLLPQCLPTALSAAVCFVAIKKLFTLRVYVATFHVFTLLWVSVCVFVHAVFCKWANGYVPMFASNTIQHFQTGSWQRRLKWNLAYICTYTHTSGVN